LEKEKTLEPSVTTPGPRSGGRGFIHRVWIVIASVLGTGLVAFVLWTNADLFLLLFAGILLAIFLRSPTDWLQERTRLGRLPSFLIVVVLLLTLFSLAGWLMAGPVSNQFNELSVQIPNAIDKFRGYLSQYEWGRRLLQPIAADDVLPRAKTILGGAKNIFSVTFTAVTGFFLFVFIGFYLSMNARFYLGGFVKLFPIDQRPRAREVLRDAGSLLQRWLVGQLISMTIIGLVTGVTLHFLGVPLAGILGFLTGFLDFIPLVGPFIAGTISVLLAFMTSPTQALYVLILFIFLQFLESHLLIPVIQKRAASLPPVLTLIAMVLFGSAFGFLGVLLATPLLAVIMVLVRKLYIEDVLGDIETNGAPPESPPPP
jgi:predicted PurR-regulated permease PerM